MKSLYVDVLSPRPLRVADGLIKVCIQTTELRKKTL